MTDKPDVFATAWQAYQAVVDHDYLWHSMAGAALSQQIHTRFGSTPIRFLDLACGDAGPTSRVLVGRPITRYVGVDRSEPALTAAAINVKRLHTSVELVPADYLDYLERPGELFDVIYVGLSAHHLVESEYPRLFAAVRQHLVPGGLFAAYEPFVPTDETPQDHIERLALLADRLWVDMTPIQRGLIIEHVRACDHPIRIGPWDASALAAGLGPAHIAVRSPDRLCQFVAHGVAQ